MLKRMYLKKICAFGMLFSILFICEPFVSLLTSIYSDRLFIYPNDIITMDWRISRTIILCLPIFAIGFLKPHHNHWFIFMPIVVAIVVLALLNYFPFPWPDNSTIHDSSLAYKNNIYRAVPETYNNSSFESQQTVKLYKCGRWGIVCKVEYEAHFDEPYLNSDDVLLSMDPVTKQIQLRVDDELIYTIDDFVKIEADNYELPQLQSITAENSDQVIELMHLSGGTINDLDWSSDGQKLMISSTQLNRIIDIEFNPDGTLIASTSADGTIRLWGLPQ